MNPEEENKKPPLEQILKPVKSLRTYQGDVEETISKNNFSSKDIFLAEQNRRAVESSVRKPLITDGIKNKLTIMFSVALLVFGIGLVSLVYYLRSSDNVTIDLNSKNLIAFSKEKKFSVATTTREKFISLLLEEKTNFKLPVNSVLYLNPVDENQLPQKTEKVLSLLTPKMPNSLSRSFSDKYMIGIFSFDTNEPFIILRTDDYALSFSGMLKWEKDMESDLSKLFSIVRSASSTPPIFFDQERRNKDLRVLRDAEGKTLLLYSFIDNNTLVITKNENIFTAILSKYLISQQEK